MLKKLKKTFWDDLETFYKIVEILGILSGFIFGLVANIVTKYISMGIFIICVGILCLRLYRQKLMSPLINKFLSGKATLRDIRTLKTGLPKVQRNTICLEIIFKSVNNDNCHEILEDIFQIFDLAENHDFELFLKEVGHKEYFNQKIDDLLFENIFAQLNTLKNQKIRNEILQIINGDYHEYVKYGAIRISPIWLLSFEDQLLAIIANIKLSRKIREVGVDSIGKICSLKTIKLFCEIYDTLWPEIRRKMLIAVREISIGQELQSFYEKAALYKQCDDITRGEAMRLLIDAPVNIDNARICLCKIMLDKTDRAPIRSQAAYYLGQLNNNAELELINFCEDFDLPPLIRLEGVKAFRREGLTKIEEIKSKLVGLQKLIIHKQFNKEIQKTLTYLTKLG